MKKMMMYGSTLLLAAVLMTSCANNSDNGIQEESSAPSASPVSVQDEPTNSFKAGVFVNVENGNEPLLNEEIKRLLQTALTSMANKDTEAFRSVFADDRSSDAQLHLLNSDYAFYQLGTVQQDHANRIVVEIIGKAKQDTGVTDKYLYFYFVKNAQGQWFLGAID
ncbi:hypothetical protein SAMN04487895_107139 [Paenibacillus sophorae]|uniref:DUF4878 domain-containing protein n=1 Tax=Paenibacillus sophorae TaxID=1333845 RepID=A0A1H8PCF9_9BACL|nr:hypothetical protein [Paenibacillus sophorae]QWU16521.1 hypothetical protein KP014_04605 [Paenibacillus sophorae]SEO39481.1 hypothetical protein SAMN04487895_107139 [Paenibacillus sophorae]